MVGEKKSKKFCEKGPGSVSLLCVTYMSMATKSVIWCTDREMKFYFALLLLLLLVLVLI